MATLTLRPSSNSVVELYPIGVGGNDNYLAVNEAISDDDTTYVMLNAELVWNRDLYNLPNHTSESGSITSVVIYCRCRRAGGTCWIRTVIKTHGVEYNGTDTLPASTYTLYSTSYTTNPNTGSAWTWTEIDDLLAGVGMESSDIHNLPYCTQVYVVITYEPNVIVTPSAISINISFHTPVVTATNNIVVIPSTINITITFHDASAIYQFQLPKPNVGQLHP